MCKILGTPKENLWPDGYRLFPRVSHKFKEMPQYSKMDLRNVIPEASEEAIKLIGVLLRYNPEKRPEAEDLLTDPYFEDVHD